MIFTKCLISVTTTLGIAQVIVCFSDFLTLALALGTLVVIHPLLVPQPVRAPGVGGLRLEFKDKHGSINTGVMNCRMGFVGGSLADSLFIGYISYFRV